MLGPSLALAGTAFEGTAARRAIGWTTAAQAGSAIVGVPLLAAVGAIGGWRMAFVAGGLAAAAVLVLATRWLPGTARPSRRCVECSLLAPYRPLLRDGTMQALWSDGLRCGVLVRRGDVASGIRSRPWVLALGRLGWFT